MKKSSIIILLMAIISACSKHASTGERLYLTSKHGPMLVVPSPLSNSNISSFYVLPNQMQKAKVSILPPIEMALSSNKKE